MVKHGSSKALIEVRFFIRMINIINKVINYVIYLGARLRDPSAIRDFNINITYIILKILKKKDYKLIILFIIRNDHRLQL